MQPGRRGARERVWFKGVQNRAPGLDNNAGVTELHRPGERNVQNTTLAIRHAAQNMQFNDVWQPFDQLYGSAHTVLEIGNPWP